MSILSALRRTDAGVNLADVSDVGTVRADDRTVAQETQAPHVHQVNAEYSYQPIRGIMCLPLDCWNLNDIDWEPLS